MGAGHQGFRTRRGGAVHAHHVAHRVDVRIHARLRHPVAQLCRRALVRRCQVGAGEVEVCALDVVGIAPGADGFRPHHDGRAEFQRHAQHVVQADFGNALDLTQALGDFVGALVFQPARKSGYHLAPREALAGGAFHGQDEREAELGVVVGIKLVQRGEFFGAAQVQARSRLFAGGLHGELARHGGLSCQFRVFADQAQLFVERGAGDHVLQRHL